MILRDELNILRDLITKRDNSFLSVGVMGDDDVIRFVPPPTLASPELICAFFSDYDFIHQTNYVPIDFEFIESQPAIAIQNLSHDYSRQIINNWNIKSPRISFPDCNHGNFIQEETQNRSNLIAVPLRYNDRVVGVISVSGYENADWGKNDAKKIHQFAAFISNALSAVQSDSDLSSADNWLVTHYKSLLLNLKQAFNNIQRTLLKRLSKSIPIRLIGKGIEGCIAFKTWARPPTIQDITYFLASFLRKSYPGHYFSMVTNHG